MDIRRWLDETVLPEQPIEVPPAPTSTKKPDRVPKKKRRRSSSDSSFLEAASRRKKTPPVRFEVAETASEASHTSRSGSSSSDQPYARKPRRKTRPERYDPTSEHRKGESSKKKRKTRRKKVDKKGSGRVQSFHAKNVPKDRLTLKPREKLGLFNKGRASSAIKGRGLPDLVFSEMKFLQRQRVETEPEPPLKKSKNTQAKVDPRREESRDIHRCEQQPTHVVDNAIIPTVELTDKASYLGSGSGGTHHKSGSYVFWSESIRAPSHMPAPRRKGSTIDAGQLDPVHGEKTEGSTSGGKLLHLRAAPPSETRQIPDGSGGRFQVSSLAPANGRVSRSHSLSQHTSSSRRTTHIDQAAKRRTLERDTSPSSVPSFVPGHANPQTQSYQPPDSASPVNPRATSLSSQQQDVRPHRADTHQHEAEYTATSEVDPQTSSSLERLILDCNTTFNEMRQTDAAMNVESPPFIPVRGGARAVHEPHSIDQRTSTVRFTGVDETRRPILPHFSGPGIYEQQEHPKPFDQETMYDHPDMLQEPYLDEGEFFDDEMMDYEGQNCGEQPTSYGEDFTELPDDLERAHWREEIRDTGPTISVEAKAGFWRPHRLY